MSQNIDLAGSGCPLLDGQHQDSQRQNEAAIRHGGSVDSSGANLRHLIQICDAILL